MIQVFAKEVCAFLKSLSEVKSCAVYGSLCNGTYDEYSDIDIEIDVSGVDNGVFATKLPDILSENFEVIFFDYAPSLAPEKYVISVAINTENPFRMVDICCVAKPHCSTVTRQDLASLNNQYDHTLKLFVANLKHFLRESDCYADILKMYNRIFQNETVTHSEEYMLNAVYHWLQNNAESRHEMFVSLFEDYL